MFSNIDITNRILQWSSIYVGITSLYVLCQEVHPATWYAPNDSSIIYDPDFEVMAVINTNWHNICLHYHIFTGNKMFYNKGWCTSLRIFLSPIPLGWLRSAISHRGISSKALMTSSSKNGNLAWWNKQTMLSIVLESQFSIAWIKIVKYSSSFQHLLPIVSYDSIISS